MGYGNGCERDLYGLSGINQALVAVSSGFGWKSLFACQYRSYAFYSGHFQFPGQCG